MKRTVAREYYEAILVAVILALFARTFVFENFKIPSGSMENNLLVGDHIVVNKFIYAPNMDTFLHGALPYRRPERGDVVVFRYPEDPRRDFIKRCVAVGGDTVAMRDKQLFVNGEPVDEPYVVHKDPNVWPNRPDIPARFRYRDNFGPSRVPEDSIFCLGDNRDNSHDSRFWGPVPLSYVKGRAVLIYWSFESPKHDYEWRGVGHRLKQLADVVIHFFSKTRWEREFRLIR